MNPEPVTVRTPGEEASTLRGLTEAMASRTSISSTPPSLSTEENETESITPRMYFPPTVRDDGMEQERSEKEAAGDALVAITEGLDDKVNRQM